MIKTFVFVASRPDCNCSARPPPRRNPEGFAVAPSPRLFGTAPRRGVGHLRRPQAGLLLDQGRPAPRDIDILSKPKARLDAHNRRPGVRPQVSISRYQCVLRPSFAADARHAGSRSSKLEATGARPARIWVRAAGQRHQTRLAPPTAERFAFLPSRAGPPSNLILLQLVSPGEGHDQSAPSPTGGCARQTLTASPCSVGQISNGGLGSVPAVVAAATGRTQDRPISRSAAMLPGARRQQ